MLTLNWKELMKAITNGKGKLYRNLQVPGCET